METPAAMDTEGTQQILGEVAHNMRSVGSSLKRLRILRTNFADYRRKHVDPLNQLEWYTKDLRADQAWKANIAKLEQQTAKNPAPIQSHERHKYDTMWQEVGQARDQAREREGKKRREVAERSKQELRLPSLSKRRSLLGSSSAPSLLVTEESSALVGSRAAGATLHQQQQRQQQQQQQELSLPKTPLTLFLEEQEQPGYCTRPDVHELGSLAHTGMPASWPASQQALQHRTTSVMVQNQDGVEVFRGHVQVRDAAEGGSTERPRAPVRRQFSFAAQQLCDTGGATAVFGVGPAPLSSSMPPKLQESPSRPYFASGQGSRGSMSSAMLGQHRASESMSRFTASTSEKRMSVQAPSSGFPPTEKEEAAAQKQREEELLQMLRARGGTRHIKKLSVMGRREASLRESRPLAGDNGPTPVRDRDEAMRRQVEHAVAFLHDPPLGACRLTPLLLQLRGAA